MDVTGIALSLRKYRPIKESGIPKTVAYPLDKMVSQLPEAGQATSPPVIFSYTCITHLELHSLSGVKSESSLNEESPVLRICLFEVTCVHHWHALPKDVSQLRQCQTSARYPVIAAPRAAATAIMP